MKNFKAICLLMLISIFPATSFAAGTPITNDMAQKYFNNCVAGAQKEGTMVPQNQQRFCACTAMNMQKTMTQEDLAALGAKDKTARMALNKVLINVNGPCMGFPVHDLIQKKCMTDLKNPAICGCLSNKMGQFTAAQSQKMMPEILARNPEIYDPLTPIMESQEFQQTQQSIALSCATNPNQQ